MVESPAFRGAFENLCELLVSPTFGFLFRRFGFVGMIENLWELPHLPNSASRWCAMRFEGSPTGDSLSKSSKWRVSPAKWVDFSRKHRDLTWFNQEKWIKNAEPRGFQQKTCGIILHDLIKKPCIKMVYVRPCTLFQPSAMPEAVAATSPLPSFRSWIGVGRRAFKNWEDLLAIPFPAISNRFK